MAKEPGGPLGQIVQKLRVELDNPTPDAVEVRRLYGQACRMTGNASVMKTILIRRGYWEKLQPYCRVRVAG